jgi:DNA modification methylase
VTAAYLVRGDARNLPLASGSVQCIVTSPPYFGLRSYGGQTSVWGGDQKCEHCWTPVSRSPAQQGGRSEKQASNKGAWHHGNDVATCTICSAWRGELGSEPAPALFVAHLVEVFREVKRVLRNDGCVFLNIGDSYAGSGKGPTGHNGIGDQSERQGFTGNGGMHRKRLEAGAIGNAWVPAPKGTRQKSLMLVPERLAIALSDDGWIIRSRIAWCKAAPMPESAKDRPTSAWEHIWVLTKQGRYYWDGPAVAEPAIHDGRVIKPYAPDARVFDIGDETNDRRTATGFARGTSVGPTRNLWNYWVLPPDPYSGAHFACVDEQTEALTVNGWKRHDQLQVGELIASYGMDDQRLRWRPLEAVAQYDVVNQPMVLGKTASLDMLLTPNHRCVIQRRRIRGDRAYLAPKIKRADMLNREDAIPTTATWDEAGEPFDRNWAELLGWYVAEGHESKMSLAVEIYQSLSVNEKKVERLRELLYAVGAEWTEATGARTWRGRDAHQTAFRVMGYAAARLRELAPAKILQPFILSWSHDALAALMAGLVGGDGHTRKDDGRLCFVQKNKPVIDLVQAVAIRLGWSATMGSRPDGIWTLWFTQHNRRSFRGTAGRGQNIATTIYSGVVWCPKTPDGTWVARRNGTVWITGNTFPREIPRRCILAATSEYGACAACGAPYKRETERTAVPLQATYNGAQVNNSAAAPPGSATRWSGGTGKPSRVDVQHLGWTPTCRCGPDAGVRPCVVADVFSGSGTTAFVAASLGRVGVGVELSAEYVAQARSGRLAQNFLPFGPPALALEAP